MPARPPAHPPSHPQDLEAQERAAAGPAGGPGAPGRGGAASSRVLGAYSELYDRLTGCGFSSEHVLAALKELPRVGTRDQPGWLVQVVTRSSCSIMMP